MKRILITGGAGFIGSNLCQYLLENGNEVICMDNYFSGRKQNIYHLFNNPFFEAIRWNVIHPYYIECDEIYNLACPASPKDYQYNPVQTLETSVLGTMNALKLARKLKVPILQASTSEIYGDPIIHPQTESYWGNVNPIGIRSCYDEGKRCAETLCMDYKRQYEVDIKIVRIFNTYGPKMQIDDGRVISNFIVQALREEDITIYGTGDQTRSFQFIDDLIDGLVKFMETRDFQGPVNIGNPKEFTIKELAEIVLDLTKSSSKIVYKDLPSDDPLQRQPDISLAIRELNWEPKIDLYNGLIKTIRYFRNIMKNEKNN